MAKLCAHREKDKNFVAALLDAGLVNPDVIEVRVPTVAPEHRDRVDNVLTWIASWRASRHRDS